MLLVMTMVEMMKGEEGMDYILCVVVAVEKKSVLREKGEADQSSYLPTYLPHG